MKVGSLSIDFQVDEEIQLWMLYRGPLAEAYVGDWF